MPEAYRRYLVNRFRKAFKLKRHARCACPSKRAIIPYKRPAQQADAATGAQAQTA